MEPYVERHLEEIHAAHDGKRMKAWVQKQHKINFTMRIQGIPDRPRGDNDEAKLAIGPCSEITT
jgi:hypothetical protein